MPFRCARGLWSKNEEPSIGEILSNPVVRTMMARDGVDEAEVRRLLTKWSERETSERALGGAAAGDGHGRPGVLIGSAVKTSRDRQHPSDENSRTTSADSAGSKGREALD